MKKRNGLFVSVPRVPNNVYCFGTRIMGVGLGTLRSLGGSNVSGLAEKIEAYRGDDL